MHKFLNILIFLIFFSSAAFADGNLVTFEESNGKLLMTLSQDFIGRELLLSSCVASTTHYKYAEVGTRPNVFVGRFEDDGDNVVLRKVNAQYVGNEQSPAEVKAFKQNYADYYVASLPVVSRGKGGITVDATSLFLGGKVFSPFSRWFSRATTNYNASLSKIEWHKSFADNFSVKARLSYDVTPKDDSGSPGICTAEVVCSGLLLPEKKMRPRIADDRIGLFTTDLTEFDTRNSDSFHNIEYVERWNLNRNKHIVYYVDDKFPEAWKEPIKKGILVWNEVFREMGLGDVIQVKDYPKDDPEFDEDNLKYNCVRYIPTDRGGAQGPSWTDPRTGERLCADVYVWGSILDFVNKNCYVETAQVNKGIRSRHLSDEEIANHLMCTINHEIGHTLGLAHNMAGSNAYPVDSLLNADFVRRNGLSASTMDYIYFNYIVPPEREDIPLTYHNLGPYDKMVLKYIYQPTDSTLTKEQDYKIVSHALDPYIGKPEYRYVEQQWGTFYDPTAVNYDISNEPLRAGTMGMENLKYVLSHTKSWLPGHDNLELRKGYYDALVDQVITRLKNNLWYTGGIYLGFQNDGRQFESVSKSLQHDAFVWVADQLKAVAWVDNEDLTKDFPPAFPASQKIISELANAIVGLANKVSLESAVSKDPYTLADYTDDIYNAFFKEDGNGKNGNEKSTAVKDSASEKTLKFIRSAITKALSSYSYPTDKRHGVDDVDNQKFYYTKLLNRINHK